jgi:hypothetical protein
LLKFLFIIPIYAPDVPKFWAFTDYKHWESSANKNTSYSSSASPTGYTSVHADKGEANAILPCKVPDFGLNPIGDDITFILLLLNVYTKSDGLNRTKFWEKQI